MLNLSYTYPKLAPPRYFFENLESWRGLFKRLLKSDPSPLQEFWAKKYFLEESFSLLAPTGIGKTSFGISLALFSAQRGRKSYLILPTRLLVSQVKEKLLSFGAKEEEVLAYEGRKTKTFEKRLEKGEFRILLTTSMFLYKNVEKLASQKFSFVFIDDVDSFLKSGRNVDKALYLLGFKKAHIDLAMSLIRLKQKPEKKKWELKKIEKLEEILERVKSLRKGVLIVSSATANPRSSRIKLFRELLDFEVGRAVFYLRNVLDVYSNNFSKERLVFYLKKFGKGALIFVPEDQGVKGVQELEEFLKEKGFKVASYLSADKQVLKRFEKREFHALLGIASYKNPLARGIDLPLAVRYCLFYGVPKIKFTLKEVSPRALFWLLLIVRQKVLKKDKELGKRVEVLIERLQKAQAGGKVEEKVLEQARQLVFSEKFLEVLKEDDEISLQKGEDGSLQIFIADVTGYLQASGRASRFTAGGLTFGLSLVLVDDEKVFKNLVRKLYWWGQEFEFVSEDEVDFEKVLEKINESRKKVTQKADVQQKLLKPVLVVVESPNKARTIASFFGKPIRRRVGSAFVLEVPIGEYYLIITASLGHIFDLVKTGGFHGVPVNGGIRPVYEVIEGREGVVSALQKVSFEVKSAFVATDPDTEGEKIGWDLKNLLSSSGLEVKRAEFHEITKRAFEKALKELRDFDENLVKAQVVRRIADRWVGFEFSQKLQEKFGIKTLSAGRVQTPVLGWIIKRAKEAEEKVWEVRIERLQALDSEKPVNFELSFEFESRRLAEEFYKKGQLLEIEVLKEEEKELFPSPPFSTDVMLKVASQETGWSLPFLMSLAQDLFEAGLITYHRTDSTTVSTQGMKIAGEYIEREFGKEYFSPRSYKKEGAHECIRPTKPIDGQELLSLVLSGQYPSLKKEHVKLYEIIFKRFIASQMKSAKVKAQSAKVKSVEFDISKEIEFVSEVLEEGFLKVSPLKNVFRLQDKKFVYKILPPKKLVERPKIYPFTHATLVFEMKKRGIGRPSTYAVIVDRLFQRKYVYQKGPYIFPTPLGIKVYNYLQSLPLSNPFLKDEFTRELEGVMDRVEKGEEDWEGVLREIYREIVK